MILRYIQLLILTTLLLITRGQDSGDVLDEEETAHFSDVGKGRLSWIVDDQTTPWIGSYYFLGSSISHTTVLLSVVDSSTGNKLAECAAGGTSQDEKSTEEPVWNKFIWTLNQHSLECNISGSDPYVVNIEPSQHARSFSVRILAIKGPRCFKNVIVQNEQPLGCPPALKRNTFSSHNFDCGCPKSIIDKWTAPGSREVPKQSTTSSNEQRGQQQLVDANGVPFPLFSLSENETQPAFTAVPNNHLSGVTQNQVPTTFRFTAHACVGYQCQNNGTCVLDINSHPNCFCPDGFAGNHCEIDLCAQTSCKNGGFCRIQNNAPVCQCPAGTVGANCDAVICPHDCLNGGACTFINEVPACRCADGFIGPNCNVRDNCKDNATCAVFGEGAACTTEPTSFAMISDTLVDSNYSCQCVNEDGHWTDCLSLALSRQASSTHKPRQPEHSSGHPVVVPAMGTDERDMSSSTVSPVTTTTFFVPPTESVDEKEEVKAAPAAVLTTLTPAVAVTDAPEEEQEMTTVNEEIEENEDESQETLIVTTFAPSTAATEVDVEEETETVPVVDSQTPTLFTILSSSAFSTSTTPSTTTSTTTTTAIPTTTPAPAHVTPASTLIPNGVGAEDELDGDDGFESVTQIHVETLETTTNHGSLWTMPTVEGVPQDGNEITEEETDHEGREIEPTESVETTDAPEEGDQSESSKKGGASWMSWAVAVIAIIVLIILIVGIALFTVRYVRKSRRLHGKYNPAREENAVASTYAMPMTSVSKQERLI